MQHIDDHTLELFVLEPDELGERAAAVKNHLAHCQGCRLLADRMRSLYEEAEKELARVPDHAGKLTGAVAKRSRSITPIYESLGRPASVNRRTGLRQVRRFVTRHPVVSATGTFVMFASVAAALMMIASGARRDSNPAYVHLNPEQEQFEVYNSQNEKLWTVPGIGLSRIQTSERDNHVSLSRVVDLDGDGTNEVVTGAPLIPGGNKSESYVRILDAKGRILTEKEVGMPIDFGGSHYASGYSPTQILVINSSDGKRKEIIVGATSVRSPSVISRLSSMGETLGEYWHFGMLYGMYSLDVNGDGSEELVACGTNDMADSAGDTGSSPAIIAVLDPRNISGKTESGQTRGFGLTVSTAELRYLVLPRSDINECLGASAGAIAIIPQKDSTFVFAVNSGTPDRHPVFNFIFSSHLTPLAVTSDDQTERLHFSLVKAGRLTSRWGDGYMRELLGRIRSLDVLPNRPSGAQ